MQDTRAFARAMRKAPATTEALLWRLLRGRRLSGFKFRRQVPIGKYIADFVCFRHRLVVEADGPLHEERVDYDLERDRWFEAEGFRVLRFRNEEIRERTEVVLARILTTIG